MNEFTHWLHYDITMAYIISYVYELNQQVITEANNLE